MTDYCCAFCKKESDTIDHVFLFSKIFSYYGILSACTFTELLNKIININIIMLGDLPLSKHNRVVNLFYIVDKTMHIPVFDAGKNTNIYSTPMSY